MMTPLEKAQYDLVHEYPGGAVKLANVAGMHAGTLANKVNPGMLGHKLSVAEAITLQTISRDYRILYAEASALNHTCVRLADWSGVSDVELLEAYSKVHKEIGDLAQKISEAFADRRITRKEFIGITKEMDEAVRAMFELRARLEALIHE